MRKLLSLLLMLVLTIPITIASTVPTKVHVDVVLSEMVILPKVLKVYRGEKIHAVPQNLITDINILIIKKEISYKGEKVYAIPIVKESSILNDNVKKDLLFVDLPLLIPLNVKVSN